MDAATVMAKIASLPRLLEAATLLHKEGLIKEAPNEIVKRYVQKNPDINEVLNREAIGGR